MTREELQLMKNVDIRTIDRSSLVDISSVKINPKDSQEKKTKDYMEQIKNPYCYLCKGYVVKLSYPETDRTIEDCLLDYIHTLI